MALADCQWVPISIHEMALQFLRAERHKFPVDLHPRIDTPQIQDPLENHLRIWMLYRIRAALIGEVPPDTQWYRVSDLTDNELDELLVIARCGCDDETARAAHA